MLLARGDNRHVLSAVPAFSPADWPATRSSAGLSAVLAMMLFTGCSSGPEGWDAGRRCHFLAITNLDAFQERPGGSAELIVLESGELTPPFAWDELVLSWNAEAPSGTGLQLEACALTASGSTPYYTLGLWSEDAARHPRTSVRGQKDTQAEVQTDTLILRHDPWARRERGESVRRVYPREVLAKAWTRSQFAAYLIYPENRSTPWDGGAP